MQVPRTLLPHRATVEAYQGETGLDGPSWAPGVTVPARFDAKRRAVRTADGVDVVGSGTVTVDPGVTAPVRSRVTVGDDVFVVLEATPATALGPGSVALVLTVGGVS